MRRLAVLAAGLAVVAAIAAAAALAAGSARDVAALEEAIRRDHPSPFHATSEPDFTAAFASLAARAPALDDDAFLVELMRTTVLLGERDGHSGIHPLHTGHRPADALPAREALPLPRRLLGRRRGRPLRPRGDEAGRDRRHPDGGHRGARSPPHPARQRVDAARPAPGVGPGQRGAARSRPGSRHGASAADGRGRGRRAARGHAHAARPAGLRRGAAAAVRRLRLRSPTPAPADLPREAASRPLPGDPRRGQDGLSRVQPGHRLHRRGCGSAREARPAQGCAPRHRRRALQRRREQHDLRAARARPRLQAHPAPRRHLLPDRPRPLLRRGELRRRGRPAHACRLRR